MGLEDESDLFDVRSGSWTVFLDENRSLLTLKALSTQPQYGSLQNNIRAYESLELNEFRILELEADDNRPGLPICNLRRAPIPSYLDNPYVAISYTWLETEYCWYGQTLPEYTQLSLNGCEVTVPSQVALVLGIVFSLGIRSVWIDALCINQEDDTERGHQVARMGQIYRNAREVLVFLGKPSQDTDAALYQLEHQDNQSYYNKVILRHRGLEDILSHKYWSRAWILQEIALAKCLRIVCGNADVRHPSSQNLIGFLADIELATGNMPLKALVKYIGGFRPDILEVLYETQKTQCIDERDTIYAKIPLARNGSIVGEPDYTITVTELCVRLATAYTKGLQTTDERRDHTRHEEEILVLTRIAELATPYVTRSKSVSELGVEKSGGHELVRLLERMHDCAAAYLGSAQVFDYSYSHTAEGFPLHKRIWLDTASFVSLLWHWKQASYDTRSDDDLVQLLKRIHETAMTIAALPHDRLYSKDSRIERLVHLLGLWISERSNSTWAPRWEKQSERSPKIEPLSGNVWSEYVQNIPTTFPDKYFP